MGSGSCSWNHSKIDKPDTRLRVTGLIVDFCVSAEHRKVIAFYFSARAALRKDGGLDGTKECVKTSV